MNHYGLWELKLQSFTVYGLKSRGGTEIDKPFATKPIPAQMSILLLYTSDSLTCDNFKKTSSYWSKF